MNLGRVLVYEIGRTCKAQKILRGAHIALAWKMVRLLCIENSPAQKAETVKDLMCESQ